MPLIPFPDVPFYPGVPALVRAANVPPGIQVALGEIQTLLASALQSAQQWGIFDNNGNQLGILSNGGNGLFQSIIASITGNGGPVLSTNAFELTKDTKISDFPIEGGSFATYNKVILPVEPVVTLALQGSASDRTTFLNLLNAACESTDLYSVVTPEVTYVNYSLERMNLVRRAERGATLLMVEITLKEIREVSAVLTTVAITPINMPQDPGATPQTSSGIVQPQDVSLLSQASSLLTQQTQFVVKAIQNLWPNLGTN